MFPKKQRIPREFFKEIMIKGDKKISSFFLLKKRDFHLNLARFAVIISKKVEKSAVKRIFLKRKFTNSLQNLIKENKIKIENLDYIFILSKNIRDKNYDEISTEIQKTFNL